MEREVLMIAALIHYALGLLMILLAVGPVSNAGTASKAGEIRGKDRPPAELSVYVSEATVRAALTRSAWPAWTHGRVVALAYCESTFKLTAEGKELERGLLQNHPVHWPEIGIETGYTWDQMYELEPNLYVGYITWTRQGWGAWLNCP
jgi:hypothetical protein